MGGTKDHHDDLIPSITIRDYNKGMNPLIPENYYPNGDTESEPINTWRSNANLFYVGMNDSLNIKILLI